MAAFTTVISVYASWTPPTALRERGGGDEHQAAPRP